MQDLLQHLREARLHATVGAMSEAERHIRAARDLFAVAPWTPLSQVVRGAILQAGRAVVRSHWVQAVSALDQALRALEDKPAPEGQ